MGSVSGLLGMAGGLGGAGQINSGTNAGQMNQAYNTTQGTMGQQQTLLGQLQGQQGLQNQSNVYNQLQGVVSGQGPNPAQAQLAAATGQNTANQAALMAGQRGAGANVGLMARQAGQQGAANQQQAAAAAAQLQAQQSLGALGQAGNMANTMAGQQIGQVNQNATTAQGEQGMLLGANQAANATQATLANQGMQQAGKLIGGLGNTVTGGLFGGGGGAASAANGGEVNQMSIGGPVPQSMLGKSLMNQNMMAQGGNVGSQLKSGGHVPGQAQVKGDSLKNDNVKALLSPGEVVIPRSVMQSKDPVRGSAEFVRAIMAKKGRKA